MFLVVKNQVSLAELMNSSFKITSDIVNILFFIAYEIILWIIALFSIPKTLYSFFVHKKYRQNLAPRFGFQNFDLPFHSAPSIWIHAVSVGETKAIVSVARRLKQLFPNNPLIISSVTETGYAEAKRSLPFADHHFYLPFDFSWVISRMVNKLSPGLVILCESDFWHNFLYFSKKKGGALALVNGKISERSMRRFCMVPFFAKRLFNLLDILCVQNNLYRARFIEAGAQLEKIVVTGNLKLDEDYPQLSLEEIVQWRQKLGIQSHQVVLTIGSTHAPEEYFFIKTLKEIWKKFPELRVILVPRHPERFKEVGRLLERENLIWINFSDINRQEGREQVILMDAMGLLRMCYQLSNLAIVAGSFTDKVGGHNILEPCWYGKPVLFGPHMQTQIELVGLMAQYKAGIQVQPDQLQSILERLLEYPQEAEDIGENGLHLVKNLKGSTKKTLQAIEPLLSTFY